MKVAKKWTPRRMRAGHATGIWVRFPWLNLCSEFHFAIIWSDTNLTIFFRKIFNYFAALQIHNYISRKVVAESTRDNPEMYCAWFLVHFSWKEFERIAQEAMEICLWVLKESNKSRLDSYSVRNSVLIISHITFRDCRVHFFPTTFLEIRLCTTFGFFEIPDSLNQT